MSKTKDAIIGGWHSAVVDMRLDIGQIAIWSSGPECLVPKENTAYLVVGIDGNEEVTEIEITEIKYRKKEVRVEKNIREYLPCDAEAGR